MSVFGDLGKLVQSNSVNSEAKRPAPQVKNTTAPQVKNTLPSYHYKDAKKTNDWDLDRIRTFIKTEINAEPNGDSYQVWYSVEYGENQREGKFYALKSHLGNKKQKTVRKAYTVDELASYFFGLLSEHDFNTESEYYYHFITDEVKARRCRIWNQCYNRQAWALHIRGKAKQAMKRPDPKDVWDEKNYVLKGQRTK